MRTNCWEFKKCGREAGGAKAAEMGICRASADRRLDGVHHGGNAGRACWVVAGTLCNGTVQGTFAKKYDNCTRCDFYASVRADEDSSFVLSATLLSRLKTNIAV